MWTEAGNEVQESFSNCSALPLLLVGHIHPHMCLFSNTSRLCYFHVGLDIFFFIFVLLSMSEWISLHSRKVPLTVRLCPRKEVWITSESSKGLEDPATSSTTIPALPAPPPVSAPFSDRPTVLSSAYGLAICSWAYQTLPCCFFFLSPIQDPTAMRVLWPLVICLHLLVFWCWWGYFVTYFYLNVLREF